ncbi:hypothetical protein P3X46_020336 [Hevea brasiliensis]|uniref:UBC core domain-containing protein n=1 Tax=Hevea brasiliensis TaxID=3981 RepID=A0ABQ9LNF1_HEVBR|nr:probable ubiquitin-conjugating enzyme E2 24 isoform X2 [Hevea brasiliensis]KAJ9168853.1 hypothetical protein P3X46_020336 [Hevea brasiliensis]
MDMLPSDSDWESFSDSGSELDFLYGGQAHSILSSLEQSLAKIDDFLSFERAFIHGDIVCPVADPSGQMGRVVNVKMYVDLENVHGKVIKNVDSKNLLKIRSMSVGDYVVHGPWMGRVDKVVDNVIIIFDDGTKCEVTAEDEEQLMPLSPNMLEDSIYPYYPGQRVQVRLSGVSKSTKWLCGAWKENRDVGTVYSVKAGLVYVNWLACAIVGCGLNMLAPHRLQDEKNLTLLPCFSHENWQLGDWCTLHVAGCKGMKEQMVFDAFDLEIIKEQYKIGKGFKRQDLCSNFEEVFIIVKTKTIVDVLWQDGGCSLGLDSQSLAPVNIVNAHEFWPGQFVLDKGACEDPHVSGNQKWGVVTAMDAKERTVRVKWKPANNVCANQVEETVSAYELVEHPDFSYCYGDIVFKNVEQADKHHLNKEISMGKEIDLEVQDCRRGQIDCPCHCYLSCIGYVTGFKDGDVEVTWASGIETKVAPNDIFRIDKYESSTTNSAMNEQNDGEMNMNQEMIDLDKQSFSLKGKDLPSSNGNSECKRHLWKSIPFLPQSTVGFFMSIAENIFGSIGSISLSGPLSFVSFPKDGNQSQTLEEKGIQENCDLCTEMQPLIPSEMQTFESTSLKLEVNHIQENKEQCLPTNKSVEKFMQFEMVGDCSDHHFIEDAGRGLAFSQVKRSWLKKVQEEWSNLEKNLPESIYVRIYEDRMNLLRAAIVGAPGTPYHDGLFFFDIYLPPEYPHEPPLVHYRSGGLRVNPNLYESGKVCLSLLNTWTGTGTEVWNPESSSVLQVLLSLQALVLNEKPYFNEAGFDKQIGRAEGEKNSVSYNENAFLMTWKSMLYLLRQPPKHFEALIEEHLRQRSQYILLACKAYMEGAPVAYPFGRGQIEHESQKGGSTGFKIMLAKLFPKLVEAFAAKGIDCSQFTELEQ